MGKKKEKVIAVYPYMLSGDKDDSDVIFCGEYTIDAILSKYSDYDGIIFAMQSCDAYDCEDIEDDKVKILHDNDGEQVQEIFVDLVNLGHKYICSEEVKNCILCNTKDDKKWKDLRKF